MSSAGTTLPKIPLDKSSDLSFLRLQLQHALSSRLAIHLPNALPEDTFRALIEQHISEFLRGTMEDVVKNITINGIEPRTRDIAKGIIVEPEQYEDFDKKLQSDVLARHAELEATLERVTELRRTMPTRIKSLQQPYTAPQMRLSPEPEEPGPIDDIERLDEVRETYNEGCKLIKTMSKTIGPVHERVQRANDVLQHIHAKQQSL